MKVKVKMDEGKKLTTADGVRVTIKKIGLKKRPLNPMKIGIGKEPKNASY